MSVPNEADFASIKIGNGATPAEVFTIACGLVDVTLNFSANLQDRFVPDCAALGTPPVRKVKTTGTQHDVTGSGMTDKASIAAYLAALGKPKNYMIELFQDNGTANGLLLGTLTGNYVMGTSNMNVPREGTSTAEITLACNGAHVWTPAV